MQINLSGHNIDITPALRDYVSNKFKRRLQQYDANIVSVQVTLSVIKLEQRADATMQLAGATVHADMAHTDMYAAIDGLVDKLDRQLVKHKEKATRSEERRVGKEWS